MEEKLWFAMRDLKRANAKMPAYKLLQEMGFEVFTPMTQKVTLKNGKRIREQVPYLHDLLFVYDTRDALDPIVAKTQTLQYRYRRGAYCDPIVVRTEDMNRFIHAVRLSQEPRYFLPEEITKSMLGRRIKIVGGALNDYEGRLLSIHKRGHTKSILVELPHFLYVGIAIDSGFIEFI